MEWKEVTLGEITNLVIDYRGKTPLKLGSSWSDSGYRALSAKNIKTGQIVAEDSIRFVDEELYRKWMKDEVKKGDILITSEAPFGQIYYWDSDEKIVLSQRLFDVRLNDEVCHKYVYYFMTSHRYQKDLEGRATGTTVTGLRQPELLKSTILLPPLSAQRSIASILSSLDRKIELNNKINADLEEMAQAIFKNWFVDFEPFKDGKFVDSELGMIPEGWKVSQIADIPHILETGKRPKGGAVEKGIPSVGAEHVKGMCAYDYSKTKYINCEFAAKLKTGKINGYELMIYKDGGKPGYFIPNFSIFGEGYPFENCYLNEHVFKLDFDGNKEFNIFCYFFFKTEQIMSYFNAQGAKAAIPGINKKDVENIYIFSPDNESVIKFGEFAYPLFKQMLKNAIENRTLSLLRDTLLPRLMSGEIEVQE